MLKYIGVLSVLVLFGPLSFAQNSSSGGSNSSNPFSFLLPSPQATLDAQQAQQKAQLANARLAQPMNLYPRNRSLLDFFSPLPKLSNSTPIGYSQFPKRSELPSKNYLRGFGFRHGGQQ